MIWPQRNQPKCTNINSLVQCQTNYRHTFTTCLRREPKCEAAAGQKSSLIWRGGDRASWLYTACCPGGCRGEHQSNNPFFILPTTPLHLLPPSLGGARWRMCMCTPCIHTDCRSIHTYCSPSVRRHRPLHSGAEWQSHKKSSTNWSIRPPLRFVFRSRSFFPGFVSSVRSSAAGHTAATKRAT